MDLVSTLGRRICVNGIGGKTSLSRALGAALDLPVIEMDALFWLPNWVERDRGEFRDLVLARLEECPDGWVLDGNYSRVAPLILPMADTVVWLNLPTRSTVPRLFKRSVRNYVQQRRICGENYERLRSMLQPVWWRLVRGPGHQSRIRERLQSVEHSAQVIEIRSYGQLNELYATLGQDPKLHRT